MAHCINESYCSSIFVEGVDASWSEVEGDFGLDRPGMGPTLNPWAVQESFDS